MRSVWLWIPWFFGLAACAFEPTVDTASRDGRVLRPDAGWDAHLAVEAGGRDTGESIDGAQSDTGRSDGRIPDARPDAVQPLEDVAPVPVCGNGVVESGEGCDDGNTDSGDGCSDSCLVEDYFACEGSPSVCTCRVLVKKTTATPAQQDGRTWGTAFLEVQPGIDQAEQLLGSLGVARCQVWVAGATYYVFDVDEFDTISLAHRVDLFGGFCGTEERLSERPADVLQTCLAILDGRDSGFTMNNVLSVLTAQGTGDATVDGFVVQWGKDDSGGGAGLYVDGFSLVVRNCLFANNQAVWGGAVYVGSSSRLLVYDTVFQQNTALDGGGGGAVFVAQDGFLEAVGDGAGSCLFSENHAADSSNGDGGALWLENGGTANVTGCVFRNNTAADDGGALKVKGLLDVRASLFEGNSASDKGGAAYVAYGAEATFEAVTFRGNTAGLGGGVTVFSDGDYTQARFERCRFRDNTASSYSGGLRVDADDNDDAAEAWVSDSLFVGNSTGTKYGGAGSVVKGGRLHLLNCTVVGNRADSGSGRTGGFVGYQHRVFTVRNSILWDNEGDDLHVPWDDGPDIQVWRSDVEDWDNKVSDEGGLFKENPLFEQGGYHLSSSSPCLDRGSPVNSPLDLDGNPRTVDLPGVDNGGVVDLGAFERQQP